MLRKMQIKPGRTTSTRVFSSWSRVGALTAFVGTRFPQIFNAFSPIFGGVLRANGASSLQDGRTQAWCQSDCFAKAPLPLYTVPPVNVHRRFSFSLLLCDLSVAHSTCSYIEPVAQCKNRSDYSFSECFYRFTGETRQRSGGRMDLLLFWAAPIRNSGYIIVSIVIQVRSRINLPLILYSTVNQFVYSNNNLNII